MSLLEISKHLDIYSCGLIYCTVCTDLTNEKDIEKGVNWINPTGISSKWKISKDKYFKTGQENPCICEKDSTKKHYLLVC